MARNRAKVLVLGGGYAGVLAAVRAQGLLGERAEVRLISARSELVHRIRLHEALAGEPFKRYPLRRLLPSAVALSAGRVVAIDSKRRLVQLESGSGLPFDYLIVALGSSPSAQLPGAGEHASWLGSPELAQAGARRLAQLPAGSPVLIVGGGLTAIETAAEIAERHPALKLSLLTTALGAGLSGSGREHVRRHLAARGVTVREGVTVSSIAAERVLLETGEALTGAFTVNAAGFDVAGPELDTDLERDALGRIRTDAELRALGRGHVFVAGDAARLPAELDFVRMSCAAALPMGAHAADNVARLITGAEVESHRFGFAIQCISLGRRDGLIQQVDARDRPRDKIVVGRTAARIKELVCRCVIGALRVERVWAGAYRWPRTVAALSEPQPAELLPDRAG